MSIRPDELKPLVKKYGLEGAVLLAVNKGNYQLVSYGRDREQCARFGRVLDDIGKMIDGCDIDLD